MTARSRTGRVVRLCRGLLIGGYALAAVAGSAVTPPRLLVTVVPLSALIGAGVTAVVQVRRRQRDVSAVGLLPGALVGGGAIPFALGTGALGGAGALILFVMITSGAVLLQISMARLGAVPPAGVAPDAGSGGVRGTLPEAVVRSALRGVSREALITQWRVSSNELVRANASGGCEAIRLREWLLEELDRRDPEGVRRWLLTGDDDPRPYLARDPQQRDPADQDPQDRDGGTG